MYTGNIYIYNIYRVYSIVYIYMYIDSDYVYVHNINVINNLSHVPLDVRLVNLL